MRAGTRNPRDDAKDQYVATLFKSGLFLTRRNIFLKASRSFLCFVWNFFVVLRQMHFAVPVPFLRHRGQVHAWAGQACVKQHVAHTLAGTVSDVPDAPQLFV